MTAATFATPLVADDLAFRYGAGPFVLCDVAFDVRAGELLGVIGPNGSGKSTLVKLLDGLLTPAGGRVLLRGKPVHTLARRDVARTIGYVSQTIDVRFPLTVMEYVLQGRFAHGGALGFESDHDLEAAHSALERAGASDFVARHLDELSGGERQRCMLARALAQEPSVLLLDEPTANLDISHQVRALDLVRHEAHEGGLAAVVVTHELNLAAEFCDRILMLGAGGVRAIGSPADVLTRERVEELFGAPVLVDTNPLSGAPRVTVITNTNHTSQTTPTHSEKP